MLHYVHVVLCYVYCVVIVSWHVHSLYFIMYTYMCVDCTLRVGVCIVFYIVFVYVLYNVMG